VTGTYYHFPAFIDWDRVLQTLCLGFPETVILLISALHVTGITGVSHCTQPFKVLLLQFLSFCSFNWLLCPASRKHILLSSISKIHLLPWLYYPSDSWSILNCLSW
jgi:hypothetical protein